MIEINKWSKIPDIDSDEERKRDLNAEAAGLAELLIARHYTLGEAKYLLQTTECLLSTGADNNRIKITPLNKQGND